MSGKMDLHPVRYELDFEDLKATEGYSPPDDFLIRELPLDAGGALPGREKTREILWYEYPSPFQKEDWDLKLQEEKERELQHEEQRQRRILEEKERKGQLLVVEMLQQRLVERELQGQYKEEKQRQRHPQYQEKSQRQLQRKDGNQRRLVEREEFVARQQQYLEVQRQRLDRMQLQDLDRMQLQRLEMMECLEKMLWQNLGTMRDIRLSRRQWQLLEDECHQLQNKQDDLYFDEMWANSPTSSCWHPDDEAPTYSSSPPARDVHKEHQVHVEHQFHVKEHLVYIKMCEYDDADIPRYKLFKSETNTQDLRLGFPLKVPYYIYAGRCNLKLDGCTLRYADLYPNFHRWSCDWVRPTTYEGDDQFVDFFAELMREAEYINTKDRVLAKAIAIANKGFRKMLYFQIELAVEDCLMVLENEEKFEQKCNLYGYIASEISFKNKKYDSVLEHIMKDHEGLTDLGSHANEDDALEMREIVDQLVRSTPIELLSTAKFDQVYKEWVFKQMNLQFPSLFNLYVNYIVEKINLAQDLDLAPQDTS